MVLFLDTVRVLLLRADSATLYVAHAARRVTAVSGSVTWSHRLRATEENVPLLVSPPLSF